MIKYLPTVYEILQSFISGKKDAYVCVCVGGGWKKSREKREEGGVDVFIHTK